jgi:protocatechuate 3,4-dioxygenase beta subunit
MKRDPAKKTPGARNLSRREMLGLMGSTAAAAALAGCGGGGQSSPDETTSASTAGTTSGTVAQTSPSCVVKPQQTEGPYFVDERLNRSDIRTDPSDGSVKEGVPLDLVFNVSQIDSSSSCTPLAGGVVNVWHCDALGQYSDVRDTAQGFDTRGQKFLRGYQVTDENGTAQFTTIYPGWYEGRTVHIHFKIRTDPGSEKGYEFTSQLYFDDAVTDQVLAQAPYATKGPRSLENDGDGIFRDGGDELMLPLTEDGQGYVGTFDIALEKPYNTT